MDQYEGLGDRRQGARRLEEGWRWAQDVSEAELAVTLGAFVERYGPDNVDLGGGTNGDHAVYVRDLDDLINELMEDVLNFEMGHPIDEEES